MSQPAPRAGIQIPAEVSVEAEIPHEHKKHERSPGVTGGSGIHGLAVHVHGGGQTAQHPGKDEARRHQGESYGHPGQKQGEHDHDADNAYGHSAHARHAMRSEMPGGQHRENGQQQGQPDISSVFPRNPGQRADKVPDKRQQQREKTESDKIDEGFQRDQQNAGDGAGFLPVTHGSPYAQCSDRHGPERGDAGPHILPARFHGRGEHVHHHMVLCPLRIGHGGKKHYHHEQFGNFHRSVERIIEKIAQEHIRKGQRHHDHENDHARGAQIFAEFLQSSGRRFKGLFQTGEHGGGCGGKVCGRTRHSHVLTWELRGGNSIAGKGSLFPTIQYVSPHISPFQHASTADDAAVPAHGSASAYPLRAVRSG